MVMQRSVAGDLTFSQQDLGRPERERPPEDHALTFEPPPDRQIVDAPPPPPPEVYEAPSPPPPPAPPSAPVAVDAGNHRRQWSADDALVGADLDHGWASHPTGLVARTAEAALHKVQAEAVQMSWTAASVAVNSADRHLSTRRRRS